MSEQGITGMKLADIMTTKVATINMDANLLAMDEIFQSNHFHHLVVLSDEGKVVGVISDRDFLKQLSPYLNTLSQNNRDLATLQKKAHQIMSRQVVFASPQTPVARAARMLVERCISCLPVIENGGELVGIVTWKDILHHCVLKTAAC